MAYAREFGAQRAYRDYREMLAIEDLDCVFMVTNYDDRGRPRFPAIAIDVMRAGCHAWIEKPPAADLAEIDAMMTVERETGKFVQVGFKKMFTPANEKAREISQRPGVRRGLPTDRSLSPGRSAVRDPLRPGG